MGDTSTRSRPNSAAVASALFVGTTPIWLPSGSMTLTSLALIFSLIFVLFVCLGIAMPYLLRCSFTAPPPL